MRQNSDRFLKETCPDGVYLSNRAPSPLKTGGQSPD